MATDGPAWYRGFCSDSVTATHAYCQGKAPLDHELDRCVANLQLASLWPPHAELAAAAHWFGTTTATLLLGDSTIEDKARYLFHPLGVRSACHDGPGVCLSSFGPIKPQCFKDEWEHAPAGRATRRKDFGLVVWNIGLHHLHLKPSRVPGGSLNFSTYQANLRRCAGKLRRAFPRALIVYMLTNDICDSRLEGNYSRDIKVWQTRTEDPDYDMQMSAIGPRALHVAERAAASEFGNVLVDPRTAGRCECTGEQDGRHYAPLIPHFVTRVHRLGEEYCTGDRCRGQKLKKGAPHT